MEWQKAVVKRTSLFNRHQDVVAQHSKDIEAARVDFERRSRARHEELSANSALEYKK